MSPLRTLAGGPTRSIFSSTSPPSRSMTQPTSSSIYRIQILRLVKIPTGTENTPAPKVRVQAPSQSPYRPMWFGSWNCNSSLTAASASPSIWGRSRAIATPSGMQHQQHQQCNISQVQRNPRRNLRPGSQGRIQSRYCSWRAACDSVHDPVVTLPLLGKI
ncbi:uncharacterized protein NFIA_072740 [Aspergillus fischeri NRRL 181]|uniref:Uncharacterized protein n=1 Tax=Neosartorya fischeri (strain ATCC 1020 / DSM 3700 / CBS 544.65 / FGSC A1164 / JCM 1740 / NRRL 181 / WB 181) TaxID=331117 RepID=A1DDA3_NEOFI|nr:uncharacterized protein NFIA_072740 [Aspergillus fischeri NRRL 181]EAW17360.1 hypothetical protein NFIA_072740 [Aspergillus fischeri NRRL 181]